MCIMYDYKENVKSDILGYISENFAIYEVTEKLADRDEWEQELYDDLWISDSVTGNASGSYYCSTWSAEEAIAHNWDILRDALEAFCCDECNPIEKGAEWCDVTIRCYLLGECLAAALDDMQSALDERQDDQAL